MAMIDEKEGVRSKVEAGLAKRKRKEFLFRFAGVLSTLVGIVFLVVFFSSLVSQFDITPILTP